MSRRDRATAPRQMLPAMTRQQDAIKISTIRQQCWPLQRPNSNIPLSQPWLYPGAGHAVRLLMKVDRRQFNAGLASAVGAGLMAQPQSDALAGPAYRGPNVIIVRFGGGVRRRETIVPEHTFAPYLLNTLTKRGVLIPDVRIAEIDGMDTSHAEGTINILTGRYASWQHVETGTIVPRIEPTSPTLFEYLRKAYAVPSHHALLINGEDRPQEEFFSFARHRSFGGTFRAEVLSLYRYKLWLYSRLSEQGSNDEQLLRELGRHLEKVKAHELADRRPGYNAKLDAFWEDWRGDYRDRGLVNPRGDRLLTELAVRAMARLQPRLMMINYQDPDYVHWGNASHYTRAIAVIDEGLKRLVAAADSLDFYAGRTVFVILPDCGRDSNGLMNVPFQHHFNTKSAHEIWALVFGPGIVRDCTLDKAVDQSQFAATVGGIMGMRTRHAEASAVEEVFAI